MKKKAIYRKEEDEPAEEDESAEEDAPAEEDDPAEVDEPAEEDEPAEVWRRRRRRQVCGLNSDAGLWAAKGGSGLWRDGGDGVERRRVRGRRTVTAKGGSRFVV